MEYTPLSIQNPIVIVEDDPDDHFILKMVFAELGLGGQVRYFSNPVPALAYLLAEDVPPLLILSGMTLPVMNGLEFKRMIDQDPVLRQKSIPFVFVSTVANQHLLSQTYRELSVQGFFHRPEGYPELRQWMYLVLSYWQACQHPNQDADRHQGSG